MSFMEDMKES